MVDVRKPVKVLENGEQITDAVTAYVNGEVFNGWESVKIKRDLTSVSGSFNISLMDKWRQVNAPWPLKPQDEVRIHIGQGAIGNGRVITGYIDEISPSFSKTERQVPIAGRDKTADLVDCSHIGNYEFKNQSLEQIATELTKPFGIKILVRADLGKTFDKFTVKQTETVFEALDRAARARGILLITSPFGNLILEKRGPDRATTQLVQGSNIISGSASYSQKNRFQKYIVKGQAQGRDAWNGKNASQSKAESNDPGITRYRPTLIVSETSVDQKEAQERANWENTFRAAKAERINLTTLGWLQQDGRLWQVNELVRVKCPFLGIADKIMLIESTEFIKTISDGTITNLVLTRKDAYQPAKTLQTKDDASASLGWKT